MSTVLKARRAFLGELTGGAALLLAAPVLSASDNRSRIGAPSDAVDQCISAECKARGIVGCTIAVMGARQGHQNGHTRYR